MGAGQGRGPPSTRQTKGSPVWFVALQAIIQPRASFYVAFLQPLSLAQLFLRGSFCVARSTTGACYIASTGLPVQQLFWSERNVGFPLVSEYKSHAFTLSIGFKHCLTSIFMQGGEVHYYVWTSSLDSRLAHVVIYGGRLIHLRHEASGMIVMPHYPHS